MKLEWLDELIAFEEDHPESAARLTAVRDCCVAMKSIIDIVDDTRGAGGRGDTAHAIRFMSDKRTRETFIAARDALSRVEDAPNGEA